MAWPWFKWYESSIWVRDSLVAMYTFIVGPWLPTSDAISEGLRHKPVRDGNSQPVSRNLHGTASLTSVKSTV